MRDYIFQWLYGERSATLIAKLLLLVIIVSITLLALLTVESLSAYHPLFQQIDTWILFIFLIEYFLRLYVAPNRLKFVFSFLGIIDFISILPLLALFFPFAEGLSNIAFLRMFRILELLRVLNFVRHSDIITTFIRSFRLYKDQFTIFWLSFITVWTIAGFGIFYIEGGINENIQNLGDSFWWGLVTMSTVGYGDITPITTSGRLFAKIIIMFGFANFAVMTALLTKVFMDEYFAKTTFNCHTCKAIYHDISSEYCSSCGTCLRNNFKKSTQNRTEKESKEILGLIDAINPDELTPRQALAKLYELKIRE